MQHDPAALLEILLSFAATDLDAAHQIQASITQHHNARVTPCELHAQHRCNVRFATAVHVGRFTPKR
ncbi:hypothetical protein APY04_1337 [Hyphomicrobium sulfonivorans]|uniref:Uncharacterized protein n=1 Tax=Hyphomicrobium sulfonivorans TaxID=121290 RepID=A0A120CWR9_HYPSL|nr:hypothetical protein APY04_1337 [Hyphomicrobium sulfonivorans]